MLIEEIDTVVPGLSSKARAADESLRLPKKRNASPRKRTDIA